jgi:hypothetical protein
MTGIVLNPCKHRVTVVLVFFRERLRVFFSEEFWGFRRRKIIFNFYFKTVEKNVRL